MPEPPPNAPSILLNQRQWEDELLVSPMPDGRRWKVVAACHYVTDAGVRVEIPVGFITDFASVPRVLWPLFPPFGKYTRAAVVHDYLYDQHRKRVARYSRAYCDAVLLEAMKDCQCGWGQCFLIWLGVRLGGWAAWSRRTKP
jgi:hypothetical protein